MKRKKSEKGKDTSMPCIKCKGGYKMKRSKGGSYPKVYKSKLACENRAKQMEMYKHMKKA